MNGRVSKMLRKMSLPHGESVLMVDTTTGVAFYNGQKRALKGLKANWILLSAKQRGRVTKMWKEEQCKKKS